MKISYRVTGRRIAVRACFVFQCDCVSGVCGIAGLNCLRTRHSCVWQTVAPVQSVIIAPVRTVTVAPVQIVTLAPVRTVTVASVRTVTVAPVQTVTVAPVQTVTVAPVRIVSIRHDSSFAIMTAPLALRPGVRFLGVASDFFLFRTRSPPMVPCQSAVQLVQEAFPCSKAAGA